MGYFDVLNKTLSLMTHQIALLTLKEHAPDLLIEISGDVCGLFDFYQASDLINIGRHAAVKSLEQYTNT